MCPRVRPVVRCLRKLCVCMIIVFVCVWFVGGLCVCVCFVCVCVRERESFIRNYSTVGPGRASDLGPKS